MDDTSQRPVVERYTETAKFTVKTQNNSHVIAVYAGMSITPQGDGTSSTSAEVVNTKSILSITKDSNTPTRVTDVKKKTPLFRPPLRRLSASTSSSSSSSSKLFAAFKSPLRVPKSNETSKTTESGASAAAEHTVELTVTEKDKRTLKAPVPSHQFTTSSVRHTPYRLTSTHSRYNAHVSRSKTGREIVVDESAESIAADIEQLKDQLEKVDSEISELSQDYHEDELQLYIDHLHDYNEIKDVGQLLLGKLAEVQGTTTAQLYHQFDLNLDD